MARYVYECAKHHEHEHIPTKQTHSKTRNKRCLQQCTSLAHEHITHNKHVADKLLRAFAKKEPRKPNRRELLHQHGLIFSKTRKTTRTHHNKNKCLLSSCQFPVRTSCQDPKYHPDETQPRTHSNQRPPTFLSHPLQAQAIHPNITCLQFTQVPRHKLIRRHRIHRLLVGRMSASRTAQPEDCRQRDKPAAAQHPRSIFAPCHRCEVCFACCVLRALFQQRQRQRHRERDRRTRELVDVGCGLLPQSFGVHPFGSCGRTDVCVLKHTIWVLRRAQCQTVC